MNPRSAVANVPLLGAGLGFRRELMTETFAARNSIDFLEVISDRYVQHPVLLYELEQLCEAFCVIPHGIGMSIGSMVPQNGIYLDAIKRISDMTGSPYYSEHLCVTRAPGIEIGHLSPLWFTKEALNNVISSVNRIQDFLGKPLVLENITYLFDIPGGQMHQVEFFHSLVEATDCGVLLDITNVYINSVNHGFDPVQFLENMPLDSVVQVHIAGGFWQGNVLVDGHSEMVQEGTWELLSAVSKKAKIRGVILEHDSNYPAFERLLAQVERARQMITDR